MSTDDDVHTELVALERRGWDSLCDGTAAAFYGDLMSEDGLMVLAGGMVMDRATVVGALTDAPPWRTYALDDVRLVRIGPQGADGAALVYRGTAYREAEEPAFVGVMSSVYVRRDGRWRLALYQQTVVPGAVTG